MYTPQYPHVHQLCSPYVHTIEPTRAPAGQSKSICTHHKTHTCTSWEVHTPQNPHVHQLGSPYVQYTPQNPHDHQLGSPYMYTVHTIEPTRAPAGQSRCTHHRTHTCTSWVLHTPQNPHVHQLSSPVCTYTCVLWCVLHTIEPTRAPAKKLPLAAAKLSYIPHTCISS